MSAVFISYVSENAEIVDMLCQELKSRDIQVWRDRDEIAPGSRWKQVIRTAIREGAFFIACFSKEYNDRDKTYMNEELTLAIEELRQRPTDRIWFIPVKLNECEIPDRDIGGGETLGDLHYVNLYDDGNRGIQGILNAVQRESEPAINEHTSSKRIEKNAYEEFRKGLACQNSVSETTPPEEKRQKFEKAFQHYARALEIKPNYLDALNARGAVQSMMGRVDHALRDFSMVIKLRSDYFAAYLNRGGIHTKDGRYQQALKDFTKVIQLQPNLDSGYFQRGEVYRLKGEFDDAIADYNRAIQLKSDLPDVYNNRGIVFVNKRNYERAILDYTEAIALNPDLAAAYFNRAVARLLRREWEEAKSDLIIAKAKGINIIIVFRNDYESVKDFEQRNNVSLPEDIAAMLMLPAG